MGIDNIWVFAQATDGTPTSGTLELLTQARSLGGTVSAFLAGDGASVPVARLSVKLDRTGLTNSTAVSVDGDSVTVQTPIFGGTKLVNSTFTGERPFLAAFRPKSFVAEGGGGAAGEVVSAPVPDLGSAGGANVTAVHVDETSGPKLDEAAVVVAGGRGLGEAEKFEMIESLAKQLKGAPGASRAIVDAGWVPYSYQVG